MSNWRFKKGIFPLPPVKTRIWEEKNLPNLLYFWPQFIAFLKNCFIYTHCDLKERQKKKFNRSIFFISLFFHTSFFASYFIINFYEGKNHPSSEKLLRWHPSLIWQITTLLLINNTIGTIKTTPPLIYFYVGTPL